MAVTEYIQKLKETFRHVAVDGPKDLHYPEDAMINAYEMGFNDGKGEGKKEAESSIEMAKTILMEKHQKDLEKMISNLIAFTTSLISNNVIIKSIYVNYYPNQTRTIFFIDEQQFDNEDLMDSVYKEHLSYTRKSIEDESFIKFSILPFKETINFELLACDGYINLPPLDTLPAQKS